jgi:hypothetical protein
MLKKSISLVLFLEVLLFIIIGSDCLFEGRSIPWNFLMYSFIFSIAHINISTLITNKKVNTFIFWFLMIGLLGLLVVAIFSFDTYIWDICGAILGLYISAKLVPVLLKNK